MSNEITNILLIEDEKDIARFIELELTCEGYKVHVAYDGMQGLMSARQINPDLIILDRMLPQMNGIEVCKRLRQSTDVPILMLTAKGDITDKVEGLDAGANDYLVKPFNLDELLARVRVQLRSKKPFEKTIMEFMDLHLDTTTREIKRGDKKINLSPKEYDLLMLFMKHPKHVLNRERILENIWGWDFEGEDNVLEVYMHSLREKIEVDGKPRILQTIRGVGYVLKEPT
ncbi:MAG: response regulator transcription factor [Candidatus Sericytochromatia bacterium]|nr:response regulator transcription factor [Candidatus Sericytochromatia bacterium]